MLDRKSFLASPSKVVIAHSNSADQFLSNNASDWLSGDFDNKSQ